jgi:hypothetical protein
VTEKQERGIEFTPKFFNFIKVGDLPPHHLKLENNTIIKLMHNLEILEGICHEIRLVAAKVEKKYFFYE